MPYHIDIDEFPPCIREFANYKRTIQGCSAKTVEEYLTDMRTFSKYLVLTEQDIELTDEAFSLCKIDKLELSFFAKVKTSQILEYLSYVMDGRNNNENTRARKLSAIKSFYKYYVNKMHILEINPAIDIESPKKKKSLPKYLSVDESVDLLSTVAHDSESANRTRDFCILTLFLNCGMRLAELCSLNIDDIDRDFKMVKVTGKGNKERIIYLNDACVSALKVYLATRQKIKAADNDGKKALFLSRLNKRISRKTVQWMVKKYLDESGMSYKGYSTHKLRHTAATLMYQSGEVDIRVLKDILGHEQLTTTQIYTHVSDDAMQKAMNNNPLASIKPISQAEASEKKDEE